MGQEIRRVPRGWQHPTKKGQPSAWQPMKDISYREHCEQWLAACIAWENGTHPDLVNGRASKERYPFFWWWEDTPYSAYDDRDYFRPDWTDDERDGFCLYNNVSEGTPVSPVFDTLEELRAWYIAESGEDDREPYIDSLIAYRWGWGRTSWREPEPVAGG